MRVQILDQQLFRTSRHSWRVRCSEWSGTLVPNSRRFALAGSMTRSDPFRLGAPCSHLVLPDVRTAQPEPERRYTQRRTRAA